MPLYEYQCEKCGDVFELIEKFSAEPLTTHEKCGGSVHRLISAPALQFKGSGWYVNDYAKSGSGHGNGGGKKDGDNSSEKNSSEKSEKSDKKEASSSSSDSGSSASTSTSDSSKTSSTNSTITASSSSDKK
jgi:putative FmdB family regulatory protein